MINKLLIYYTAAYVMGYTSGYIANSTLKYVGDKISDFIFGRSDDSKYQFFFLVKSEDGFEILDKVEKK